MILKSDFLKDFVFNQYFSNIHDSHFPLMVGVTCPIIKTMTEMSSKMLVTMRKKSLKLSKTFLKKSQMKRTLKATRKMRKKTIKKPIKVLVMMPEKI